MVRNHRCPICVSLFAKRINQKTTRLPPESRYLSAAGIAHLRQQYTRTTKESLKRAIRHRIDDIRGDGGVVGRGGTFGSETTDINTFVLALQGHSSNDLQSVVRLWKGKPLKDRSSGLQRSFNSQGTQLPSIHVDSESDSEIGLGKLLKGVSKRTKKIGEGVTGQVSGIQGAFVED